MNNIKIKEEKKKDNRKIIKKSFPIHINITKDFLNQIKFLVQNITKTLEWSGIMFYDTKGEISNLEKFEITPTYIYLMDIGKGATTDFDYTTEISEFKMNHPEFMGKVFGKIHSHNQMSTFMSGTDIDDLHTNSKMYNMYLSIVTNNNLDFSGGIDINYKLIEKKEKYSFINSIGKEIFKTKSKKDIKYTEYHDLKFFIEEEEVSISKEFEDRLKEIKKKNEKNTVNFGNFNNISYQNSFDFYNTNVYGNYYNNNLNEPIEYEDDDILNILYNSLLRTNVNLRGDLDYKLSKIYNILMTKLLDCNNDNELDSYIEETGKNIDTNINLYLARKKNTNDITKNIFRERFNFFVIESIDELLTELDIQNEKELVEKIERFMEIFN